MENIRKEVAQTSARGLQGSEHGTVVDGTQRGFQGLEGRIHYTWEPFSAEWASPAGGELPDTGRGSNKAR